MMSSTKVARFDIQDLLPIGMTFVVLGIALAYGISILSDMKPDVSCNSSGTFNFSGNQCYDATFDSNGGNRTWAINEAGTGTDDAITAVAKLPSKMGLIVTVVIAAVIIGILLRYLVVRYI